MTAIIYEDYAAMSEQDRMRLAVSIASAVCAVQGGALGLIPDPTVKGVLTKTGGRWSMRSSMSGAVDPVKERKGSAKGPATPESRRPGTTLRA